MSSFPNYHISGEAMKYFEQGYKHQMAEEYELAEKYYKMSLEIEETAEGHTFLGWNYSFMGKVEKAIEECKKAIEVDPDFGNPYNDIGSYLISLNKLDDAIPWLEKAKKAVRYENPEYAYANLAKVHELKGVWPLALKEYNELLRIRPDYYPAILALKRLSAFLN